MQYRYRLDFNYRISLLRLFLAMLVLFFFMILLRLTKFIQCTYYLDEEPINSCPQKLNLIFICLMFNLFYFTLIYICSIVFISLFNLILIYFFI